MSASELPDVDTAVIQEESDIKKKSFNWLWSGVVCLILLILGSWSFARQVSYPPPAPGSRLRALQELEELKVLPLDTPVVPGKNSPARWILGDGFSEPELNGVWISALNSFINFHVEETAKEPRSITFSLMPLLSQVRKERILTIVTSGKSVTQSIEGLEKITVPLNGGRTQTIRIECDSIDSPFNLRIGPDYRPVCALLVDLYVSSV